MPQRASRTGASRVPDDAEPREAAPAMGSSGGHAQPVESEVSRMSAAPTPQGSMTRRDIYGQPMRGGRPVPSGPLAQGWEWLRVKLSTELQLA